jgi:L-alanine-DL-glutamate epimerase-like enolase superfamily enzyme
MLATHGVHWFEEPLTPDALADYIHLRQRAPLPIAGGEVLTRRQSFQPWLHMLAIPAAPGLGLRLDPDEVAKYTGGQRLLD